MSLNRFNGSTIRSDHRSSIRPRFEPLEERALRTGTFTAPDLTKLLAEAHSGRNTASAMIAVMSQALQTQLQNGPLTGLDRGIVSLVPEVNSYDVANLSFVIETTDLLKSFDLAVDAELLPAFPHVDSILKLQASSVQAQINAIGVENINGFITDYPNDPARHEYAIAAPAYLSKVAIETLNAGPLHSPSPVRSKENVLTRTFLNELQSLIEKQTFNLLQGQAVIEAETSAYQAEVASSLTVTSPRVYHKFTPITDEFTAETASLLDQPLNNATITSALDADVAFVNIRLIGKTGVFGADGALSRTVTGKS